METSAKDAPARKASAQERTRRLILDHAAKLLRAKGYASTSLRDIAAATGMKAGSLYYHFESKEALAEEVMAQGIRLVEEKVRAAIEAAPEAADPLATIRAAIVAHLEALHERGDYASANIRCYAHVPPEVKARLRKVRSGYETLWADLIETAREAGRIDPGVDGVALRFALIGMMNWTLEWRPAKGPAPAELGAQFYRIAFQGAAADG